MKKGFKRLLSLFGLGFLAVTSGISLNAQAKSAYALEEAPEKPVTYEENTLVLHLFRNDGAYNRAVDMHIWQLEPKSLGGVDYEFTHEDDYGVYLELSTVGTVIEGATKIGLINRNDGDWGYGQTADMHYSLKDAVFDEHKAKHLYFVDLESTIYESVAEALSDKVLSSVFSGEKEVSLKTNYDITGVVIKENGVVIESTMGTPVKNETEFAYYTKVTLSSSFVADFKKTYTAEVSFKLTGGVVTTGISSSGLFDTTLFEETLTYDGNDLGLTYSAASSTFKVWAPTSDSISLRIYNTGTPLAVDATLGSDGYVDHEMVLGEKGVWSVSVNGDLHGKYYTYFVKNYAFPDGAETADPYGRAAGVNGDRTMILDLATTNPEGWDEVELKEIKNTELVVYELHVADLTMDESWTGSEANRGKYLGLIEEGTTYKEGKKKVTTGFDHIKELGVNALQILPFFDQDNDEVNMSFNWGDGPFVMDDPANYGPKSGDGKGNLRILNAGNYTITLTTVVVNGVTMGDQSVIHIVRNGDPLDPSKVAANVELGESVVWRLTGATGIPGYPEWKADEGPIFNGDASTHVYTFGPVYLKAGSQFKLTKDGAWAEAAAYGAFPEDLFGADETYTADDETNGEIPEGSKVGDPKLGSNNVVLVSGFYVFSATAVDPTAERDNLEFSFAASHGIAQVAGAMNGWGELDHEALNLLTPAEGDPVVVAAVAGEGEEPGTPETHTYTLKGEVVVANDESGEPQEWKIRTYGDWGVAELGADAEGTNFKLAAGTYEFEVELVITYGAEAFEYALTFVKTPALKA